MRAALLGILMASLSLSGCLFDGPEEPEHAFQVFPGDGAPPEPDAERYWVVWIRGNETRERVSGPDRGQYVCSIIWDHDLDRANRSLDFDGDRHEIDNRTVRFVVVFDHWEEHSSCPIAYTVYGDREGPIDQDMGEVGNLSFEVRTDGTVVVEGEHEVPPGDVGRFAYTTEAREGVTTYRYEGTVHIELLGAWPRDKLVAR